MLNEMWQWINLKSKLFQIKFRNFLFLLKSFKLQSNNEVQFLVAFMLRSWFPHQQQNQPIHQPPLEFPFRSQRKPNLASSWCTYKGSCSRCNQEDKKLVLSRCSCKPGEISINLKSQISQNLPSRSKSFAVEDSNTFWASDCIYSCNSTHPSNDFWHKGRLEQVYWDNGSRSTSLTIFEVVSSPYKVPCRCIDNFFDPSTGCSYKSNNPTMDTHNYIQQHSIHQDRRSWLKP